MALKSGSADKETAPFPCLSFTSFISTSGTLERVVGGPVWITFREPKISTSSSTLVAVWGEFLVGGGGTTSSASRLGLAALVDSSSISSVLVAGAAASRGGEGDLCWGELWPVAGSSNVASALKKEKVKKGQTWL